MKVVIKKSLRIIWKVFKWTLFALFFLFLLIFIIWKVPAVHDYAVKKGTEYFNDKTGGDLSIGGVDLKLPFYIGLENILLNDPEGSKLASIGSLDLYPGWRMLFAKTIRVDELNLSKVDAKIFMQANERWNFDFIIAGFTDTTAVEPEPVDSSASSWSFSLGDLNLTNISFVYADRKTGDSIDVDLGSLALDMEELDLENGYYSVEELALEDNAVYLKFNDSTTDQEEDQDEETSPLPEFELDVLMINQTEVVLKLGNDLPYSFRVGSFSANPEEIDLRENRFHIDDFTLSETELEIPLAEAQENEPSAPTEPTASDFFAPIDVKLNTFNISNLGIKAYNEKETLHTITGLTIEASDISANPTEYAINLEKLSLRYNEFDGLKDFSGDFALRGEEASAGDVHLEYGDSKINLDAFVSYTNPDSLISSMLFNKAEVEVDRALFARKDLKNIVDALKLDSIPIPRSDIELSLKTEGSFDRINLSKLRLKTGKTELSLTGNSKGSETWPRDAVVRECRLYLDRLDLTPFTELAGVDTSVIPPTIGLDLVGKYLDRELKLEGLVSTKFGKVELHARGDGWKSERQGLELQMGSKEIQVGKYLKMEPEFFTDFNFVAESPNINDSLPTICSHLDIDTLHYDGYGYTHLRLDADLLENDLLYAFAIRDTFVNTALGGKIQIGDTLMATVEGEVFGLDMQGLNFSESDIRGGLRFYADFYQDGNTDDLSARIDEILFVKKGERFPIKPISGSYYACPDSTSAHLKTGFMEFNSVSNRSLDSIKTAITDLFARRESKDQSDTSAYWRADFIAEDLGDIKELFLPDLKRFEPSTAEIDFSAAENKFVVQALFPGLEYGSFSLDSLSILTEGTQDDVIRNLSIKRAAYDTLPVTDIDIDLNRGEKGADFRLSINPDTTENHYLIKATLAADSSTGGYRIAFGDTLLLAGQEWQYQEGCALGIDSSGVKLENFEFLRDQSSLALRRDGDEESLIMTARSFPLRSLSGIVVTQEILLTGDLDGELTLNRDGTFEGSGKIQELTLADAEFGLLTWNASRENGRFKTLIENRGKTADFVVDGTITPTSDSTSALALNMNMTKFELEGLSQIFSAQIDSAKGLMTADISIAGTTDKPSIEGTIGFPKATIKPAGSREVYSISNQSLKISPNRLDLNGFTLVDGNGRELNLNGDIRHQNFKNPKLDIRVLADNFMLLDIDRSAGQSVYGKLIADLDMQIRGGLNSPLVKAQIAINEPSDLSYFVTETVDREAFDETLLVWTEFEEAGLNENSILARNKETRGEAGNIFANNPKIMGSLKIDESAVFRVVIDSSAGDYLEIRGGGKLDIDYDRMGALRFNGIYEVADGFYQMTFYNLVKRKFDFRKGSRIVWNGEPTNANIDITAVYKTRAGIANLMLTDPSAAYDEAFQQQLPFLVLMDIKGKLLDPEIFFDIQLEKSAEGALSGSVEARLQDLTRDENRLNKQVFALLVLGSFIPQSGGSDANILANQARNSASQILTNQLNSLSDKYVKGVDINVDLYSYGGTAGEGNTDLNINVAKSFANNRMTVKVGSTIALEEQNQNAAQATQQQFLTNIELEYKLTPDGRYRLVVFSKTDLEDIVIGRITRSGGGFVFQRDFDRFRYLFDPPREDEPVDDEAEEENEEEEDATE